MRKHLFNIVMVLLTSIPVVPAESRISVLNPGNDFPAFTQQQIDDLNGLICTDIEKSKIGNLDGIYTYRVYTLCLRDKYEAFIKIPAELRVLSKKRPDFYVENKTYAVSRAKRKGKKKKGIEEKRFISVTSIVLDSNKRYLGKHYLQGFIPVEDFQNSYEAILLYALSKKEEMGFRWYFQTDIGHKYVIGVTYGNEIYVFCDKEGKPVAMPIDEFPENEFYEYKMVNSREYPDLKEGIKWAIYSLMKKWSHDESHCKNIDIAYCYGGLSPMQWQEIPHIQREK